MVGVLLLTHENFGEAVLKSAALIIGEPKQTRAIGLNRGDDIAAFSSEVKTAIADLDEGDGVLVFVDLFGASPYNATALASANLQVKFRCIAGFSFPMVLEALTMRENGSLEELTENCIAAGQNGIKELFEEIGRLQK